MVYALRRTATARSTTYALLRLAVKPHPSAGADVAHGAQEPKLAPIVDAKGNALDWLTRYLLFLGSPVVVTYHEEEVNAERDRIRAEVFRNLDRANDAQAKHALDAVDRLMAEGGTLVFAEPHNHLQTGVLDENNVGLPGEHRGDAAQRSRRDHSRNTDELIAEIERDLGERVSNTPPAPYPADCPISASGLKCAGPPCTTGLFTSAPLAMTTPPVDDAA